MQSEATNATVAMTIAVVVAVTASATQNLPIELRDIWLNVEHFRHMHQNCEVNRIKKKQHQQQHDNKNANESNKMRARMTC